VSSSNAWAQMWCAENDLSNVSMGTAASLYLNSLSGLALHFAAVATEIEVLVWGLHHPTCLARLPVGAHHFADHLG
jgi:hypothetical protein